LAYLGLRVKRKPKSSHFTHEFHTVLKLTEAKVPLKNTADPYSRALLSEQYSDGGVIPNKNPGASYELLLDSLSA
jgi:hypothetical protein